MAVCWESCGTVVRIDTETVVLTATSGIHIVPEGVQPGGRTTQWYRAIAGRLGYTRTHQRQSCAHGCPGRIDDVYVLHRLEVSVQRTHEG
jgi:hypothetical protein